MRVHPRRTSYVLSAVLIFMCDCRSGPNVNGKNSVLARVLGITETIEGARYVKHRPSVSRIAAGQTSVGSRRRHTHTTRCIWRTHLPRRQECGNRNSVLFAARGIGTAVGPIVARRIAGEGKKRLQVSIGIAFLIGERFTLLSAHPKFYIGVARTGYSAYGV